MTDREPQESVVRLVRPRRRSAAGGLVGVVTALVVALVAAEVAGDAATPSKPVPATVPGTGTGTASGPPGAVLEHGAARPVTGAAELVGRWSVVEVRGGSVPHDAVRGLRISRRGADGVVLGFSDGVNRLFRDALVGPAGALRGGMIGSTLADCVAADGSSCSRPSGFGVAEAWRARLTAGGHLVLVGARGRVLAVYEPA